MAKVTFPAGLMERIRRAQARKNVGIAMARGHIAGSNLVAYARSYVGPHPDGKRKAHPGHWADKTGRMEKAYWYKVTPDIPNESCTVEFGNKMFYASFVDGKKVRGTPKRYWVVRGMNRRFADLYYRMFGRVDKVA